jgi:signal-transduction protein with cAMP-binding, CBS, and nucleotidyltransferase domain
MTREVVSCEPSADVTEAEELMVKRRKSRILIVESGRIRGILSLADIAQCERPLRLAEVVRGLTAREFRMEPH